MKAALPASILAGAVILAAVPALATDYPSPTGGPTVSGAIRCTNGHWSAIDDSGHTPHGITKVTATSTYVTIYHDRMDPVGSMQVTADYDYNRLGITVGASVGITTTRVNFVKDGRTLNPSTQACQPWTNVWVTGFAG
jgi:hypothetical protein